MTQSMLLALLTLIASVLGTATGFGTSTVMVPVLGLLFPLPVTLLFVGIIHLCGDIWKIILFRTGLDWRLVLGFGLPGIAGSYIGASLTLQLPLLPAKQLLGGFLVLYVVFLLLKTRWSLPRTNGIAVSGGLLSGLFAGFFGVGGAVRGAFLAAYDLPKDMYIFTSGLIALFIDASRISRYMIGGTQLGSELWYTLLLCIPLSFCGAVLAKRFLAGIPQKHFRVFVALFLGLVGLKLLLWTG